MRIQRSKFCLCVQVFLVLSCPSVGFEPNESAIRLHSISFAPKATKVSLRHNGVDGTSRVQWGENYYCSCQFARLLPAKASGLGSFRRGSLQQIRLASFSRLAKLSLEGRLNVVRAAGRGRQVVVGRRADVRWGWDRKMEIQIHIVRVCVFVYTFLFLYFLHNSQFSSICRVEREKKKKPSWDLLRV